MSKMKNVLSWAEERGIAPESIDLRQLMENETRIDLRELGDDYYQLVMEGPAGKSCMCLSVDQLKRVRALADAFIMDWEVTNEAK